MADGTKIEWTDSTWNPITGCAVVSPGCTNCYAMKLAGTRLKHIASRRGLTRETKAGPVWTGEIRFNEEWLTQPLSWSRPRMIFVCAHGDLFAEGVTDEMLDKVFAVMAIASQHTFQVLTKRPKRMREYLEDPQTEARQRAAASAIRNNSWDEVLITTPLKNVWLGISAEDQKRADERLPDLLQTPAALRWISAEPLLGLIDLDCPDVDWSVFAEKHGIQGGRILIDWVVAGGESGQDARPMQPGWARSLRDQCEKAGIPFLFKQWGNHRPCSDATGPYMLRCTKAEAGRHLDGQVHDAFPSVSP